MIRLWLTRRSAVSVQQQLGAQLLLGILSGRLAAGERLPSVRALARRLSLHPNTVSAVYRDLAARGCVDSRPGSGVYVAGPAPGDPAVTASDFVRHWIDAARAHGLTARDLLAELHRLEAAPAPSGLGVVDSDPALAEIFAAEIAAALGCPVEAAGPPAALHPAARLLLHAGHAARLAPLLDGRPFLSFRVKTMPELLAGQTRPAAPFLLGVVSRSPAILSWAGPLLSALGFAPDQTLLRNPADPGWQRGLATCGLLAADICAARELPPGLPVSIFRLIAEDSLTELRARVTAAKPS